MYWVLFNFQLIHVLFENCRSTFWRIIKHGSTEEYESLPYICALLNSSLWTYYGLIKPGEWLVATVNGFGIFAEAVYVLLFLIYAPKNVKVLQHIYIYTSDT